MYHDIFFPKNYKNNCWMITEMGLPFGCVQWDWKFNEQCLKSIFRWTFREHFVHIQKCFIWLKGGFSSYDWSFPRTGQSKSYKIISLLFFKISETLIRQWQLLGWNNNNGYSSINLRCGRCHWILKHVNESWGSALHYKVNFLSRLMKFKNP